MRLHKMNEENESTGISITKVYKMLTDGLRDYIIPSSDLADVLDDWEYTVGNDLEGAEVDLPLNIPFKLEEGIEFGFGSMSCDVPSDFSLKNVNISLKKDMNQNYFLTFNAPTLQDIVNYFCDYREKFSNKDFIYGDVDTESNTKKFIDDAKEYLDNFTKGLNTILVQLAKMDRDCYPIWQVLYDEKNRLK